MAIGPVVSYTNNATVQDADTWYPLIAGASADATAALNAVTPFADPPAGQGLGASVVQTPFKYSPVTIDTSMGRITMAAGGIAPQDVVDFLVNCAAVKDGDVVCACLAGGGTNVGYLIVSVAAVALQSPHSFVIRVSNAGPASGPVATGALVISYRIFPAVYT